jgi:hypothetical protein
MRRSIFAVFALLVFSAFSQQGISVKSGFLKTEEFTHMNDQSQHDYAMGVVDLARHALGTAGRDRSIGRLHYWYER